MNVVSLSVRNLLRNRRRSLTTLVAMVIGIGAILIFGGYCHNIIYGLQTTYVQKNGHLQIQHKDYFLNGSSNPAKFGITSYRKFIDLVKTDPVLGPMLAVVTPKLQVGGIAGNFAAGVSRTVFATGIVVAEQDQLQRWNDYGFPIKIRSQGLAGTDENGAVIGTGVARALQLCGPLQVTDCPPATAEYVSEGKNTPGDIAALTAMEKSSAASSTPTHIEMLAANAHGVPNVTSLDVVKAVNQGIKEFDDVYMEMHLSQAQRLVFGSDEPQVTAILVQLQHTDQMPVAKARLEHLLSTNMKGAHLAVLDFSTIVPMYGQSVAFMGSVFGFIAVLIGVIVLFTVGNTMSMTVVERTVEIGTLRAIGLRRAGIRRLFICEGAVLGVIGAAVGVAASSLLAYVINHQGLTWIPPGFVDPVPLTLDIWGQPWLVYGAVIGMMMIAVFSAWWPATRAAKLNIVEALRHV